MHRKVFKFCLVTVDFHFTNLFDLAEDCELKKRASVDFESPRMAGSRQVGHNSGGEVDVSTAEHDSWTAVEENKVLCPLFLICI